MLSASRYSEPVTFDQAVADCTDDDDCVFPDPESAVYFYNACVAAGIEIPAGVFRVDARISREFGLDWITSDNRIVSESIGIFTPANCTIAAGNSQVTCGINFVETRFECLGPVDTVPALIGSQSALLATSTTSTQPNKSCPEDDNNWVYVNDELCIR